MDSIWRRKYIKELNDLCGEPGIVNVRLGCEKWIGTLIVFPIIEISNKYLHLKLKEPHGKANRGTDDGMMFPRIWKDVKYITG